MSGFLSELGKKLAERWLSLLVLPGALFIVTGIIAAWLGHRHALDAQRVIARANSLAEPHPSPGTIVLLAAVALAAAALAGLVAQVLGALVEALCVAEDWQRWVAPARIAARVLTARRQRLWTASTDPTNRSVEMPNRPTSIGDRIDTVGARLRRQYALEIADVWTYLWLVASEPMRSEVTLARAAIRDSTVMVGWGVMYLAVGLSWWPALAIGFVCWVGGYRHTRTATDAYARSVEALAVLQARQLAQSVGLAGEGPLDRRTGTALSLLAQGRGDEIRLLPPAENLGIPPA